MSVRKYIDDLTPERILELASRPSGFRLSRHRWRDEKIAKRCRNLIEAGRLRVKFHDSADVVYERQDSAGSESNSQNKGDA